MAVDGLDGTGGRSRAQDFLAAPELAKDRGPDVVHGHRVFGVLSLYTASQHRAEALPEAARRHNAAPPPDVL